MAKQIRRPNVSKGVLVPLGNGFSLAIGKHPNKTDDIDIGPNNKNGLSVNHGEILQNTGDSIRVFSAEPIFGGVSPSQLLYGGMNPNAVFAAQEQYKRANRINDDGSHYAAGGNKIKEWFTKLIKTRQNPRKEDIVPSATKTIDWSGINTTNNRKYNVDYINYINNGLIKGGIGKNQRAAILANIIEESGGDPFAVDGTGNFKGILQWEKSRYWPGDETDAYKELDNQVQYILDTVSNSTDRKSWTHGGKGSGYNSLTDAMAAYNSEDDLEATTRGYTLGYVRPTGGIDSYNNRLKVAQQIIDRENFKAGGIHIKPSKRGTFTAAAKKHGMGVQAFANKVLANKGNYSSAMVKKANFARNASKWHHHLLGGEDTLINPLGERPNAKYTEMNKRNHKYVGGPSRTFISQPVVDLSHINANGDVFDASGNIIKLGMPETSGLAGTRPFDTPIIPKSTSGLTGVGADLIGAGINAIGSISSALINRHALDKLKFTPRQALLLNPVKLKTKINIEPQVAQMRETVAGLSNAARRTSASSRNAYQKIANARLAGLQNFSDLMGKKENAETELINKDKLNQQSIANANTKTLMDTINTNIAGKDNLDNTRSMLRAQNNVNLINNLAGIVAGERGLLARRDARRTQAANLAMLSLAYPDAAKLMEGDGWEKAFNGYYNMLNNRIGR